MNARAEHADRLRWARRLDRPDNPAQQVWASSRDVVVQEQWEADQLRLTVIDAEPSSPAMGWSTLIEPCWSWTEHSTVHDGWMGAVTDSVGVLHLRIPAVPNGNGPVTVRCRWARHDPRPLLVHVHLGAGQTVEWHDETAPMPWQRTARVWHVGDNAQLWLSNPMDPTTTNGVAWWDDTWSLAPAARVHWVEHLGGALDVRRRTRVNLQAHAVWKMASVGWLLPQRWHDHEMNVQHHGERSDSHLHHRTVLLDRSQRRLTSCVAVDPQALDGFTAQTMQHWPLGDPVTLAASPQLAIGIGALRGATHGAAVGRFDPQVVQAMRGRGLPLSVALRLMLDGALRDALDRLDDGSPWWGEQRAAVQRQLVQGSWLDAAQAFWDRTQVLDGGSR